MNRNQFLLFVLSWTCTNLISFYFFKSNGSLISNFSWIVILSTYILIKRYKQSKNKK